MSAPCPTCAPLVEHLQGQVRRWYGQLRAEQLAAWERDEWGAEHPGIPEEPPDLEAGPKGLSIHFGDEPSRSGLLAETERLRGRVRELEAQLLLARSTAEAVGVDAARARLGFPSDPDVAAVLCGICGCGLDDCAGEGT